ncbi:MAG: aminodeoxychorismate synthase component I [Arenicella sp.]
MKPVIEQLDSYIGDTASLFGLIAEQPWSHYLDSGAMKANEYIKTDKFATDQSCVDILVFSPQKTMVTYGTETEIVDNELKGAGNHRRLSTDNPIDLLKKELNSLQVDGQYFIDHEMPFAGGAIGYFGYELAGRLESLPQAPDDNLKMPEMAIGIYLVALVTCHLRRKSWLVDANGQNESLCQQWQQLITQHNTSAQTLVMNSDCPPWQATGALRDNMSRQEYHEKFARVKQYLHDGDCYQVNLTKRFCVPVQGNSWSSYLRMRELSPAPFAAYLNFPFATVLSNSPEQFIGCLQGDVLTSPIKGTRPRDKGILEYDLALAQELEDSEKDQAENLMIVDLMRNDIGRVCETGSVEVTALFSIESYTNVHHMVSKIVGRLRSDQHALDLLSACFPGGSITGAPKKRAMEVINELEPNRRGVYCGAIGWVDFAGNMQTNIAIRTITVQAGKAYFSAGGGLVIDSVEESEYQEILDKAEVMLKIVGVDSANVDL